MYVFNSVLVDCGDGFFRTKRGSSVRWRGISWLLPYKNTGFCTANAAQTRITARIAQTYSVYAVETTEDVLKSNMIDAGEPASINLHQRKCTAQMSWQICDRSIFSLRPLSDSASHYMR